MWEGNPNLDALEMIRFPGITPGEGNALAPYRLLAKAARKLAAGRYDLGVVLRFDHWWGAALLWAAGVPRRWGYGMPGMRPWLTNVVPYTSGRHEVEQDLRLLQPLAESLAEPPPAPLHIQRNEGQPPLTPPNPAPVDEALLRSWLDAAPSMRVVIHPGTAAANKLWTVRGWAKVADWLLAQGYSVALTGAPDEQALCAAIEQAATVGPLNLAGRTASIAQLSWVMEQAAIVLGVDSGPLHIADALGKPTLHLYGPSDEAIWGPWGDPAMHRAFRAPGTHPTHRLEVGSAALEGGPEMQAITPGMVKQEIEALRKAL
jgi:ADP-heptose:LPS heptosyltransferase